MLHCIYCEMASLLSMMILSVSFFWGGLGKEVFRNCLGLMDICLVWSLML